MYSLSRKYIQKCGNSAKFSCFKLSVNCQNAVNVILLKGNIVSPVSSFLTQVILQRHQIKEVLIHLDHCLSAPVNSFFLKKMITRWMSDILSQHNSRRSASQHQIWWGMSKCCWEWQLVSHFLPLLTHYSVVPAAPREVRQFSSTLVSALLQSVSPGRNTPRGLHPLVEIHKVIFTMLQ